MSQASAEAHFIEESIELVTPVRFEITADQIQAKRAEYAALTADSPKGYEAVRLAIADCRTMRVAIEKRRKELKADALEYGRLVDGAAKKLTELIESLEEPLKLKKAAVDEEKARVKREKEEAARRELEEKIRARSSASMRSCSARAFASSSARMRA